MKGKGLIVNRAELAGDEGVALTTVDAWVRDGCPVVQRGTKGVAWSFNTAQVSTWCRERIRAEAAGTIDVSADELRRRKLAAETEIAELELAKAKGEVAPISEFEAATTALCASIRPAMRSIPPLCASKIGAVREERQIAVIILSEIDRTLSSLANADLMTGAALQGAEDGKAHHA